MPSLRPLTLAPHRPTLTAILGEFTGTFLFLLFAFLGASITASYSSTTPPLLTLLFVALAFGLSLTANVWAFFRITGAAFNPAVTVALFVITPPAARSWARSLGVVAAQLLGGIAAAAVAAGLVPGDGMPAVDTALGGGASVPQGLFIEVFLTAELVFVILMVGVEKHKGTFMAPAAVGTAFFLTQLVGINFTGGSLNPARSLGPAVISGRWPGYFWIYFVGPVAGGLLASGFYALLQFLRWEECNPGQDWDDVDVEKRAAGKQVDDSDSA
ncbi:aquaporin-2 [Podospora conica]|nr:aquaporin-2 [Schizothecium conicum]